jgi:crossover junction endodeoxyribonuclease RuvC
MFDAVRPVLGIDPGLSRCGYGAVVREGGAVRAVAAGVLCTDRHLALPDRLAALHLELEALLDDLQPVAVAVERVLFQVNARTAISVGQASGLALAAAARRAIPVVQYSPNEVKLAVTGDGAADKQMVQAMVTRMLRLAEAPKPADAADALALALCHLWRARVTTASTIAQPAANTRLQDRIHAAAAQPKPLGARAQRAGVEDRPQRSRLATPESSGRTRF